MNKQEIKNNCIMPEMPYCPCCKYGLTEQKEPCDFCKNIYTIEATSYTYTEPIASLSGLSESKHN